MDRGLTVGPSPPTQTELKAVSPTLGSLLVECPLSVAFRLDPAYAEMRRTSVAAALGIASHALAEAVARGAFDEATDPRDALETAWRSQISTLASSVAEQHPGQPLSPPERWPRYESIRVRTIDGLVDEIARRCAPHGVAPPRTVAIEVPLRPADALLEGRADRVERGPSGIELVHLKTGLGPDGELQPHHRRQLLVYAYLWHAIHGEWPQRASIERLGGSRLTFDVDPEEATAVAAELIAARAAYNAHASEGADVWQLGRPGADSCRYCDFRPACRPFFDAAAEDWDWYRKSCVGYVTLVTHGDEQARIDLEVTSGNVAQHNTAVLGVPSVIAPSAGAIVAIVDALPTRRPDALRVDADTRISVWCAGDAPEVVA